MSGRKNQYNITYLFLLVFCLTLSGCGQYVPKPVIHIPAKAPNPKPIKNVKVALALGAGGSRGIAHFGVLEVLEEAGIPIDLIVGSSAGSMVGALYADKPKIFALKSRVLRLRRKDLLDPSLSALFKSLVRLTGPIQGNALERFLLKELQAKKFEELKIPLVAVATNVDENDLTLLRSGPIAPAIHASSALPPLFAPVYLYGQTLIDGGVISPIPVSIARQFKPKVIIAVDISTPPSRSRLGNGFELLYRALDISFYELSRMQSARAEIIIHPDLEGFGTFDDEFNHQLYERGRIAALQALPWIKRELKKRGISLKRPKTIKISNKTVLAI